MKMFLAVEGNLMKENNILNNIIRKFLLSGVKARILW